MNPQLQKKSAISTLCAQLLTVRHFSMRANSLQNSTMNWQGKTTGNVRVLPWFKQNFEREDAFIFEESGIFIDASRAKFETQNRFGFCLAHSFLAKDKEEIKTEKNCLQLFNCRGEDPILLLEFLPQNALHCLSKDDLNTPLIIWQSKKPHQCAADLYEAKITQHPNYLEFLWTIKSARKNELLCWRYE